MAAIGVSIPQAVWDHMWHNFTWEYRNYWCVSIPQAVWDHMWRCRTTPLFVPLKSGFNTASGMRSHVTCRSASRSPANTTFQYRKRYEITCDSIVPPLPNDISQVSIPQAVWDHMWLLLTLSTRYLSLSFQYRKRYEITCDYRLGWIVAGDSWFQYRKRYEITCDEISSHSYTQSLISFNTASGMRSHVTGRSLLG